MAYTKGGVVRVFARFRNGTTRVDPNSVSVQIKTPQKVLSTYTYPVGVAKDAVGDYHFDVATNQDGDWLYFWQSTGDSGITNTDTAVEKGFHVDPSDFQRI